MLNARWPLFIILIALVTACTHPQLSLFSTYSLKENLASYRVRTPDPALNCPTLGQHIYVHWHVNRNYPLPLELKLYVRFGNRTEILENVYLTSSCGTYVYSLLNDAFFEKNGILTFKAELLDRDSGSLIEEWVHQLWVDRIIFPSTENDDSNDGYDSQEKVKDESNTDTKQSNAEEKSEKLEQDSSTEEKAKEKKKSKRKKRKRKTKNNRNRAEIDKEDDHCKTDQQFSLK